MSEKEKAVLESFSPKAIAAKDCMRSRPRLSVQLSEDTMCLAHFHFKLDSVATGKLTLNAVVAHIVH